MAERSMALFDDLKKLFNFEKFDFSKCELHLKICL